MAAERRNGPGEGMAMGGGSISVARPLPIDAALVGDVLLHLRRDSVGSMAGWSLGRYGTAEVDVNFFPVVFTGPESPKPQPAWLTTARLWDRDGSAAVSAAVELRAVSTDACELVIRPDTPLGPWWAEREAELEGLTHAALDELAEELLWHATRPGVAAGSSHD